MDVGCYLANAELSPYAHFIMHFTKLNNFFMKHAINMRFGVGYSATTACV